MRWLISPKLWLASRQDCGIRSSRGANPIPMPSDDALRKAGWQPPSAPQSEKLREAYAKVAATVFHSDIKNPVVNSDGELLLKLLPIREEDESDMNGTPVQVLNAMYGTIHIWMKGERLLCGWHSGSKALPKKFARFHESLTELRPCNTGRGEHRAF